MKNSIVLIIGLAIASTLSAQVIDAEKNLRTQSADSLDGWKRGGVINLNVAQTSLTNWAAGGQNSVALNGLFSAFANYKKGNGLWENTLDIGYGILKQEGQSWWKKTDDKLEFTSKYGTKAFNNWYYALLLNFRTQLTSGYNYTTDSTRTKISDLFAPAYLVGAIGLDYKPSANTGLFIAPLTGKITIVNDTALSNLGAFGVDKGDKTRSEFGGYLRFVTKKDIMENITLQTKLDLFTNYLKNPQNIDVNWESLVSMKINKYISAVLTLQLIYDDDVKINKGTNPDGTTKEAGPRVQFKEVLGIGFSYKF